LLYNIISVDFTLVGVIAIDQFLGFKENHWFWFLKFFKNLEPIGFGFVSKKNSIVPGSNGFSF
jgi:hypothetical protein